MARWTKGGRTDYTTWSPEFLESRREDARCYAAGQVVQAWMDAGCPVGYFAAGERGRKAFVAKDRVGESATYVPMCSFDVDVPGCEDRYAYAEVDIRGKARVHISETSDEQAARMKDTVLF